MRATRDSPLTPTVAYYYDQTSYNGRTIANGLGRRTGMHDASGQTAWSHNVKGEVLTEQRTIGSVTKTITYAYNADGSLYRLTYPSGQYAASSYDASGQLSAMWDNQGVDYFISPTYAANGALNQVQSNGYTMAWTYGPRFWPQSFEENPSGSTHRVYFTYGYLGNGDVSLVQNNNDLNRTANYTYDTLNRIATAYSTANSGGDCWGQSFGYDRYGNLTAISSTKCSSPTMSVTVNNKNQVTNAGFTYDNAGRLTADKVASGAPRVAIHLPSPFSGVMLVVS